jgi:FAD/FMN-containing dehydrogenase
VSATLGAVPAGRARDAARYAIGGSMPSVALRPASFAEVAGVVRECAQRGLVLVPWGGGVSLSNETTPPPRYDLALDTGALDEVAVYEPDDYTVTAGCGITLAHLRERLAEHGQELPLETAAEGAATLGGVLACNASGARRLSFGSPRDRILGARFVTGDGTLAHTGGRVVKNVAGHAVHRLLVGSRGGLAVLVQASLKLMPRPPARVALVHGVTAAALADPARWSGFARREPAALTVLGRAAARAHAALAVEAPFTVVTGFEGDPAWVEACRAFVADRLGPPAHVLQGDAVPALWRAIADAHEAPGPRLGFASAHNTPAALAPLLEGAARERLLFHAPAGRLHLWPEERGAGELARALAAAGFTLIESRALALDVPLPPAAVLGLRSRLASALDPQGVMAYGARWRSGA